MFPAATIPTATLALAVALVLMRMRPNARRIQTICMVVTGTALAVLLASVAHTWLVTAARWTSLALVALFGKLIPDAVPAIKGMCAALPWVIPAVLILVFVLQVWSGKSKGKGAGKAAVGGVSRGSGGLKPSTPWLGLLAPMALIMVPWSQLGIGD